MARIFDIDTPPENIPDKPKKNSFGWRIPSQQELRPVEGFATEPEPAEASGLAGFVDSFTTGVGNVGRTAQATAATYAGDLGTVEKTAKRNAAVPKAKENAEFMRDYAARIAKSKGEKDDVGLLDAIGDFAAAAWANPTGAAQAMVEQLPNAAPILAGGMAGAKAGAVGGTMVAPGIGTAIGTAVGAFGGMFLGNAMIETGSKAMEKADRGFTEKERSEAIHEGATKGAVIAGIDLATLGIGGRAMKLIGGAAVKAGAMAEAKVLLDAGVDVTSASAIKAALATDSELLATAKAAGNAAAKAELSTAAKAGRASTGLMLETFGEGGGEYLGEVAATGKGNVSDAVMEGFMGAGQSSIETAHNYNKAHSTGDAGLISRAGQTLADAQQEPTGQPPSTPPAPPPVDTNPDLQMQNRDRGTAASVVQMKSIANAPDFDRLGASPIADVGAPLVSIKDNADGALDQGDIGTGGTITLPDGAKVDFRYAVVDANAVLASHDATGRGNPDYGNPQPGQIVALTNGRMAGLQEAYKIGTASQPGGYMDRLMEDAATFGIQVESITGKEAPVLVRLYDDAVNARPDIGKMSNAGGSMRMSAQEVARNDARILPDVSSLVIGEHGDLESPENQPFLRGFVHALPANERSEVLDREGRLSQVGMRRIRNAIIHRAYGESSVFGRLVESLDSGMANLSKALIRAAPKVARVKDLMAAGAARDMDVTATLIKAVAEIETMRKNGLSMADFLAQARMFDQLSPELVEVLAFLDANLRSPNRIAAFIELYYQKIEALGDPRTLDMFGAPQISSANVLKMAATAATREVQDDGVNEAGAGLGGGTGSGEILTTNASGTPGGETTPRLPGADQPGAAVVQQPASPASSTEGATAGVEDGATGRADAAVDREGAAAEPDQPAGSVAAQRPVGSSGSDADRPDGSAGKSVSGSREDSPARTDDRGEKAVNGTGQKIVNELKRAKKKKADQHAASDKFDAGGLQPGTPEYNAAFDAWLANRESSMVADANKRQRDENRAAIEKRNKWRKLVRDWFESASDGDSITDVTGQEYRIIEKTRKDGTRTKTLVAVDENGNPLPDGRAATGISKVGDRVHGLQDGVLDEDTGSSAPESSPQSFAASLGQQLESGEAKTGKGISIQQQKAVAPSAQTVTAPSTAPEHVPADASRPADDGAAQWNALTPAGRRAAMKAAGVKLPDAVMWEHISDANKQKLRPVVSNMLEHAAEPQAATSPAPAPAATQADAPKTEAAPEAKPADSLFAGNKLFTADKVAAAPTSASERYNALVKRWNDLVSSYQAADDQGKAAIKQAMDLLDAEMKAARGDILLDGKRQAAEAQARARDQLQQELAAMPVGARMRPSEFGADAGIFWEKTGDNEWTARGDWFQKGQTRTNAELAERGGLVEMPAAAAPSSDDNVGTKPKQEQADPFAGNKLFTSDKVAAARERLRKKLSGSQLNSGIDPELLMDGITIAGAYIESGVRNFTQYAARMIQDMGDGVKPYLLSFWEAARNYPGLDTKGMTSVEESKRLHEQMLTPEVKAQAAEAIGEVAPKPAKRTKKTGAKGDMTLTQDWGVEHINGYGDSTRETGNDTKDAFLNEARNYLNAVADALRAFGFEPHLDRKGKPEKAVSVNESGMADSGDVTLTMRHTESGTNVYVHVGDTSLRGVVPSTPSGISVMYRVGAGTDRYATKAGNTWAPVDLSANDLAALVNSHVRPAQKNEGTTNAGTLQTQELPRTDTGEAQADAAAGDRDSEPLDARVAGQGAGTDPGGAVPSGAQGAGGSRARGVQQSGQSAPSTARDSGAVRSEQQPADPVADPATAETSPKPELDQPEDFNLEGEDIGKGGLSKKYRDNLAAIRILKAMADEGRVATPEERKQIARYVGWGALKGVFDPQNKQWSKEYAELKELLTDAEYKAARASTLNAHYTSPTVVGWIFEALDQLGFTKGRVLEPSVGTGNFFGLMPAKMRKASQLHGVELDPLTSQIAAALYPSAKIAKATGFQDFQVPAEYFDLAIGNPPFGSEPLVDEDRSPYSGASIHNYFFAKSIDKLRPGGLLAMVVSHNFLDAKNDTTRRWIAERANLVSAVRLPRTAFKENAGTEVVTDILIFQKKTESERVNGLGDASWVNTTEVRLTNPKTGEESTHRISSYFEQNPSNVLGTPTAGGSMYRANEYTVEPLERSLEDSLTGWVNGLPQGIYQAVERTHEPEAADVAVPDGIKVGSYFVANDGSVQIRGNDVMGNRTASAWTAPNAKAAERMKGMIGLRDALRAQMRLEKSPDATEDQIEAHRRDLNAKYDAFQKSYGYLNDPTNRRIFMDDTESALLLALEFDYDKGVSKAVAEKEGIEARAPSAVKADIFKRRVMFPPADNINVSNAKDALLASLNYKGRLDLDYMASLYDKPQADIVSELGDVVFDDPLNGLVMADEYLSGDVKTKLAEAEAAARDNPVYKRNVDALKKVIPANKRPSEIHAALGAPFIPAELFEQFAKEVTGATMKMAYIKATGQWIVDQRSEANATLNVGKWGIGKMPATAIFARTMAGQGVVVTETLRNPDGSTTTVVLERETEAAREKQAAMKAEWQRWLWADADRADMVADIYNEKMNRIVPRKYDGSHMTFPGMSPAIELLPHQKNAVWRALQSRQVLLDHVVGAGKTFEVVALFMEMRRLGIARKPFIAVPNHLTLQWRSEFSRLYPAANVLAATPDDFAKGNREKFFSKIITGDWDAVIVGHSSLKKIALPPETEKAVLEEQITEIASAIEDMKRARGDRNIIRDIEGIKARLEARMKQRLQALGERDKVVTFDELGVDAFAIDELHEFKNLFYNSTMERVPGMGNPSGSDKAFDLFVKLRWMFDTFGDKAPIIGATGTPVSNSLVEMFNMQRFLQYPMLKREGLHVFDAWAKQFGSVESLYEVSPSGTGYRQSSRFAKFKNLPALMAHYQTFADTVTLDDLKAQEKARGKAFPVPKVAGGRPVNVVAKRSPQVARFMGVPELDIKDGAVQFGFNVARGDEAIIEQNSDGTAWSVQVRSTNEDGQPITMHLGSAKTEEDARLILVEAALSPKIKVDPESILGKFGRLRELNKETKGKVNALSLTGLANKAGLDYRLIDPSAPDFAGSKINLAVDRMMSIYHQWAADKGTQLVFCDLSVPLSSRSGFGSKERRIYVRDNGAITHKRGTMHTVAGHEDLPFFLVKEGSKDDKSFAIYDAATGLRVHSGLPAKDVAIDWAGRILADDAKRQRWIDARDNLGDITQDEIDDYNNANEIDTEETEAISLADIAGVSGATGFSVYDDIKAKLIAKGVPEREIAFIHDYSTPVAKDKLFKAVNAGNIRFLLGSTPKMGAGTNVQKRLVALHHIDAPWRPSDLEQREGRIIRRGNELYERDPENFEVAIFRYATEQTYDTRRWQILEHKARGIEQLRKYDGTLNEIDDIEGEAANSADMKAAASGDPLILEETQLRNEVRRLEALQASHADESQSMVRRARDQARFANEWGPRYLAQFEQLKKDADAHPVKKDEFAGLAVDGGKRIGDRDEAVKAIKRAMDGVLGTEEGGSATFTYRGIEFSLTGNSSYAELESPTGQLDSFRMQSQPMPSAAGFLTRFANYINRIPAHIEELKSKIAEASKAAKELREQSGKPFEHAADLIAAREAHKKVQRALMRKGPDVPDAQKPAVAAAIEHQKQRLDDLGFGDAVRELMGTVKLDTFNSLEDARSAAISRSIAMLQGKDVPAIKRESARLRLGKLSRDLHAGKISEGLFINEVEALQKRMDFAAETRKYAPKSGRARGADFIRQKLLEAKRRGDINEETADMAEWFILKNPDLVEDLGISIRAAPEGSAESGSYNPATRVMLLFKDAASDTTAVHEILHHLERMMPAEMQDAIRKEWIRAATDELQAAIKSNNTKRADYFMAVLAGDQARATKLLTGEEMGGFNDLAIGTDYQYLNPSEFWAVRMTNTAQSRFKADTLWQKTVQWLKEALEHIKGALGLKSDHPLLKALNELIARGTGEFQSKEMLSGVGETRYSREGQQDGRPFKPVDTESAEFKAWFGGSKVVDADGNPIVVSHFTDADNLTVFDRSRLGENTDSNTDQDQARKMARLGFWFSDTDIRYTRERRRGMFADNKVDVYLSIKNPVEFATFDDMWAASDAYGSADEWRDSLESAGHDGVIVKDDNELGGTSFIAFDPTQVKSATSNTGEFSATNPDIRYSRGNRGGVHADDMAAAVETLRATFPGLQFHPLEQESQAPDELLNAIKAAGGDVAAAMHKGEVYLFAPSLKDASDVLNRGLHEAVHVGLARMFGTALDPLLLDIHRSNVKVQLRAARIKAKYGYSPVRSVEEVLADMGPEAKSLKGWQKLVAWVRSKLRAAGLVNEWRDSDIEALVLRALAAAKKPADTHIARGSVFAEKPVTIDEKPKFSRTEQPEPEPSSIDIRNATLQRVEEILRRKASGETIIDTMIRVPMQAVGIDKVTRLGGKVVRKIIDVAPESIKAGMVSDYGNPDDAINHRDAMFGHQRRRLRGVADLMERMAVMSREESRVAYEWLNNRNADELLESLPEKSRADMIEIKQQIDDIGKEAVDLGLLSVDAYEAHKGAYVHRSYRKWDIDSTKGERTSREYTKQILGEQFKTRGLTELVPMVRVQNTNPTFWKRKIKTGTADHGLRGEQFIRFERHKKAVGTASLPGVEGAEQAGKVVEVQYWPASEPVPARYGAWHQAGTFTVRGTKGDKLIMNRDWTKSEREKMGEIEDARYAIAKTFHQMIHDIEVAKYLQWIAGHYGKEVPPRGVIPVKASESMRNVFGKDDWVQVPNSTVGDTTIKRYGKLSGLYIPGPIWNDIRQVANHNYQPFGETYANILKAWKLSKTALSPGVHTNNIMSNFVMADWHDVRAGDVLEALHIIVRQKDPANKELLGRFEDSGGTIGMYTLSEIKRDQLEPLIEQLRADVAKVGELHGMVGAGAALQSLLHGRMKEAYEIARSTKSGRMSAAVVKKMMDLYEDEDTVFRLAAFIKAKRNGATDLEAGKIARRSFLDYNINAPWIQAMRQTAFPFISFTYRAVPMLLEIIETKPWKIAKLAAFAGLLNALGYALSGGDEDKERRYLPKEKSGRVWGIVPKLIRMPWNDANDSPVFLDIRRWIPVGDVLDTGQSHAALPLIPVVIPGGPVALLAELLANKSQFTGKAITKGTDTAGEKTAAVIEHLFKAFAPNLFFLPGTYAATSVVNAGTGRTDVFGREQSVGMALASGIGIKLAAYPTDVLQRNATLELKGQLREINENMYGLGRERAVGGLSDADFSRKIQRESEKRERVVEEFQRR